jgi:D-glycero-D-manno-heptose 1,7-bisphosphate phosphatase
LRPCIFFDRDNTLIATAGYLGSVADLRLIDGAAEAVARARDLGFAVVVASNQSGVARGLYTETEVQAVNRALDEMLLAAHPAAQIDRHAYCPYHPDAVVPRYRLDSELRKPRPGMLLRAAAELGLDLGQSWMIGDAPRDIEAGRAAGCRTVLLRLPGLERSPAAEEQSLVRPDQIVASLSEALDFVERSRRST